MNCLDNFFLKVIFFSNLEIIYNISNKIYIMNLLSIVVPCFNEDESVGIFLEEIQKTLKDYNFEVIYVNDGSIKNWPVKIQMLSIYLFPEILERNLQFLPV